MATKEAVLFLLDVGSSMYEKYFKDSSQTRLDLAITSIKMHLQQKIFYSTGSEVALMLFGADEAKEENTLYVREFLKPDFEFIRNILELTSHETPTTKGGDIFDALQKGLSLLDDHTKAKKYTKKIFLLTNGAGETNFGRNDISLLCKQTQNSDTKINIIAIDFCTSLDPETQTKIEEELLSPAQKKNEEYLLSLTENCTAKIFSAVQAIEIYKQFRTKSVATRCKLRVPLEITSEIKIDLMIYAKTAEQKLPGLKKYSTVAPFTNEEKSAEVIMERKYFVHDDPNMDKVENEYKIKGFYYGKQLVPISRILEESLKFPSERCLKVLGFVPKKNMARHFFLSGVDIVLPPNQFDSNQQKFNALVDAMIELNEVALVRYVSRANTTPHLAALYPNKKDRNRNFYLVTLPTIEDIRDFQFPSLKECTNEQLDAAEKFIDALNLTNLEDEMGEKFEGLKPNSTFNPILQNFYQYICSKTFDDKNENIMKIDPIINEYIHPENKLYKAYAKDIEEFKSKFVLKEITTKKTENQKVFWRKLLEEQKVKQENASTIDQSDTRSEINLEEMAQQQKMLKHKKFNIDDDEDKVIRNISPINPIDDFKSMITNKSVDLVDDAVGQMKKLILRYVNESIQGSFYKIAIECLRELRKGCINEDEAESFNLFMYEIREKFSQGKQINFWFEVIKQGVTLITNGENHKSKVTAKEASEFLVKQEANENEKYIAGNQDIMDEIE